MKISRRIFIVVFKKVKKALIDQNLSVTKLADITGYTRVHLYNVINGHLNYVKPKKAIALALGKDFNDLWSEKSE